MSKRLLKRLLPKAHKVKDHKHLRVLGTHLHSPNLWHLNRNSVARAVAIGLFCAFLPFPMQMLIAASLAIMVRANILISVVLVWLSNPITMPAMMYGTYKLGAWLLLQPPRPFDLEFTWHSIFEHVNSIVPALLFGSILCGVIAGGLSYAMVQICWRLSVMRKWRARNQSICKCPSRNS